MTERALSLALVGRHTALAAQAILLGVWNVWAGRVVARLLVTLSRGRQRCASLANLRLTFRPSADLWWCSRRAPWLASWVPGCSMCEDRVPADLAVVVERGRRRLCSPCCRLAILRTVQFLRLVGYARWQSLMANSIMLINPLSFFRPAKIVVK